MKEKKEKLKGERWREVGNSKDKNEDQSGEKDFDDVIEKQPQ